MKQSVLKFFMLALLGVVGASAAWAEKIYPDLEVSFRTNNDNSAWNSGFPKTASVSNNEYEINYFNGFFALQKFTVPDLAAVKKLTLNIAGPATGGGAGQDAVAIWAFTNNTWTSSTDASTIISAVSSIVGIDPRATTGDANNTYLLNTCGQNRSTVDGVQYCHFEITGDALTRLKNSATGNTFTLLITNRTQDLKSNTQRKYYSSGHATVAYRPYVEVNETYPAAIGMTGYETLNAAFDGITTEGTITLYDDITITSCCNSGTKNINVVPAKEGIKITSTLTNSLWFLTQSGGTISIGSDSYQLVVDGNNNTNSSCFVEAGNGGNSSTTFKNVKFLNCVTSASAVTGSIISYKSNNGYLYLKNVSFEGCQATSENRSMIFCGLGELNIQGSLNITNCTSAYDIYIENNNTTDKIIKYKTDATEPTSPIRLYFKTPTLGTIALSTSYKDMTSWFKVLNAGCGLGYNVSNGDNKLTEASDQTVTDAGAATLVLPFEAKIPAGVTAYTLTYSGGDAVSATEVTGGTLAANTPVLLNAEAGTYKFVNTSLVDAATTGSGSVTYGALTGVYTETTPGIGHYILTNHSGNVGFRKTIATSKVAANHAYLTATAGARDFLFIDFLNNETTGVNKIVQSDETSDKYYDLQGRQVTRPTKGLYIVNGRKVLIP